MVGLIWFVQIVHYPLHSIVGPGEFEQYQAAHMSRTSLVVVPPMLIELAGAAWFAFNPIGTEAGIPSQVHWLAFGILAAVWVSTAFLQVPVHNQLLVEPSAQAYSSLVNTNWIRTIGWSLRGLIVCWVVMMLITHTQKGA